VYNVYVICGCTFGQFQNISVHIGLISTHIQKLGLSVLVN